MTSTSSKPTRDLLFPDLSDSIDERIAWFQHQHRNEPLRHRAEYNMWEVFRYDDVQRVLKDAETFSVTNKTHMGLPFSFGRADIQEHRFLRSFVSRSFVPSTIESRASEFAPMVDALLEPALSSGRLEVLGDLGYPLMEHVIGHVFGLQIPGPGHFRQWSDQMFGQLVGIFQPDHAEVIGMLTEQLNDRKNKPTDDLMSALLVARAKDDRLSEEKIVHMCVDLVTAGNAPLSLLLSYTFARFCKDPEFYQALRHGRSKIMCC